MCDVNSFEQFYGLLNDSVIVVNNEGQVIYTNACANKSLNNTTNGISLSIFEQLESSRTNPYHEINTDYQVIEGNKTFSVKGMPVDSFYVYFLREITIELQKVNDLNEVNDYLEHYSKTHLEEF